MAAPLVALLYSSRFVPPDVLAFIAARVPPGFAWQALDQASPRERRRATFEQAAYMLAYPGDPSAEELAAARNLKLFQLLSAGYEWLQLEDFRRAGIPVAANDGSNSVSTAEHALLLMLAVLKQLPRHHESLARGRWLAMDHVMEMRELRGRTVGLVGFGRIAQQLARRLRAFEATVVYTKPTPASTQEESASAATYCPLDELLARADIVSLHLPLTPQTRGLIDRRRLMQMRPGSCLINTARGALVDEEALVDALRDGPLAGAGLDVFAHEPPASGSALLQLPNVVLTPHIAGSTRDAWSYRLEMAWANIRRVAAGEPPRSQVT